MSRLGQCPIHVADETGADSMPYGIRGNPDDETAADPQERQPYLPEVEAMVRAEDEGKGPKEEIKDAEKDSRVDAQAQAHGLEDEQLERPQQGQGNCSGNGLC